MKKKDILNMSSPEQQTAFIEKCTTDAQFAINSLAAVLSNEETKSAFKESISSVSQAPAVYEELEQILLPIEVEATLLPIEQRLSISISGPPQAISVSGNPAITPTGHFNLLSYNGDELNGLLAPLAELLGPAALKLLGAASNIYKILPLGFLITCLTQALLGTKAGPAILLILLIL